MKLRKLTSALVAAGALSSPFALGLGLGDISLKSSLNQPLQAEIKLLQTRELAEEEILPSLASEEEFNRAGVERFFFLSNIDFDVELSGKGDGSLLLTTKQTIQEPFLNFLVEVNWPNGRVLREYTVLLDPPVYEDTAPAIVVTPQTKASTKPMMDAEKQVVEAKHSRAVVTPVSQSDSRVSNGTFGPVSASDTLWNIAIEVRPDRSVTVQQTMMAIRELNPNAFVAGNINKIKKGSVLRVPTLDQIQGWTQGSAVQEVAAHNKRYQQSIHPEQASQVQLSGVDHSLQSTTMKPEEARLKIVRSEEASAAIGAASGDQSGEGAELETIQNELAITQENLDKANRENEKLSARIEALEERMSKLSRLVTLKDTQMAELQMAASDQITEMGDMAEQGQDGMEQDASDMPAAAMPGDGMSEDMASEDPMTPSEDMSATDDGMTDEVASTEDAVSDMTEMADGMSDMASTDPVEESIASTSPEAVDNKPIIKLDDPVAPMQQPQQGLLDKILGNPVWLAAIGAGALLFVILLFMMSRRSYQRENELADVVDQDTVAGKTSSDIADEELNAIDQELDDLDLESKGFGQVSLDGDDNLEVDDVVARADSYIAYGQFDNATNLLDEAINSEPSRIDLRLKMLEVYAEMQDTQGFERQKQEIINLGADDVLGQINVLEQKLPGSIGGDSPTVNAFDSGESLVADGASEFDLSSDSDDDFSYSLEDLESELASDLSGDSEPAGMSSLSGESDDLGDLEFNLDEELGLAEESPTETEKDLSSGDEFSLNIDLDDTEVSESVVDNVDSGLESLDDLEMSGFESDLESAEKDSDELAGLGASADLEAESAELSLDSSLDLEESADEFELDVPAVEDNVIEATASTETDELSIDMDAVESVADEASGIDNTAETADLDMDSDLEDLAKSLGVDSADEVDLDAELASASETEVSALDVSETALDETVVEGADTELQESEFDLPEEEISLDESTELTDMADDMSLASSVDAVEAAETVSEDLGDLTLDESLDVAEVEGEVVDELSLDELSLNQNGADVPDVEDSAEAAEAEITGESSADDLVKADLNEEELDFYVGTDEVATKLDLARAYVDMGDVDGAKDILEEVIVEGNEDQKTEATELLNGLS